MFADKYSLLSPQIKAEIANSVITKGAYETAKEYAPKVSMNMQYLYKKLNKMYKKESNSESDSKPQDTEIKLSKEEKDLLARLATGEASIEEVSRAVAVKVFEKMLKNPHKFQYADFIKTELLKVKKEESVTRDNFARELIVRMFAGKLPPKTCPNCGHILFTDSPKVGVVEEGEVLEPISITSGITK